MKRFVRVLCFISVMVLCVYAFTEPLSHFNYRVEGYKNQYNNADVLLFGSSHAYCNLNAATFWNEYGIAMSSLAQGEQPYSMSYYMLEEALRYRKPRLVVMEIYMTLTDSNEYDKKPEKYVDALLTFPIWKNLDLRIEAAQNIEVDYKLPYILGFPFYHDRINETTEVDSAAGFAYLFEKTENNDENVKYEPKTVTDSKVISDFTEEYIRKTIDLCNEKNVDVLFVLTPFQMSEEHLAYLNDVTEILEEEQADFIDMNLYISDIGIDLDAEMVDAGHASITGADKNSRFLAKYISEAYAIPDERDNREYSSWSVVYQDYLEQKRSGFHHGTIKQSLVLVEEDKTLEYHIQMKEKAYELLKDMVALENVEINENMEDCDIIISTYTLSGEEFSTARWRVVDDSIENIDP